LILLLNYSRRPTHVPEKSLFLGMTVKFAFPSNLDFEKLTSSACRTHRIHSKTSILCYYTIHEVPGKSIVSEAGSKIYVPEKSGF